MNDLDQYYKVLGLEPGASPEEVNQAYKDLAFIWHPDRIPEGNARLRQKAQEKLKEINQARDQLRSVQPSVQNQTARSQRSSSPTPQQNTRGDSRSRNGSAGASNQDKKPPRSRQKAQHQSPHQTKSPPSDLSGADFRGADLKEKDLSGRNLSYANLSQANLSDAFLHKVNLQGANLHKANLFRANLLESNLKNANLRETNLIGADLSGADLSGADLSGAKVGTKDRLLVKLVGTNLAGAILPDGTIHN